MVINWMSMSYTETFPVLSSTFVPNIGTEEIESCTVTLRDSTGAIAGTPPLSAVDATDFVSAPDTAPYAWYKFNPADWAIADPATTSGSDAYTLEFLITDTNNYHYASIIGITIYAAGV